MHVLTLRAQPHPRGYTVELISVRNGSPRANLNACSGCLPTEVVYHACTKQSSTWCVGALFLNKVISLNGTYTEYKTIFMEKKVVRSTIYNGACLPGLSLFRVSHTRLRWPLSLTVGHWSGRIPSAGGKGGRASFLRSTAPRQHVPICGTRRSLWPSSGAAGPTPPARRFRPPPLT